MTEQVRQPEQPVDPKILQAQKMAQAEKEAKLANDAKQKAIKTEQAKTRRERRKQSLQKFSLRIKNGIERAMSWYEQNWSDTCYDGIIAGAAVALFGALLLWATGAGGLIPYAFVLGGAVATIPIIFALAYWAIKGVSWLVKATVTGIKNAALNMPKVKDVLNKNIKDIKQTLQPANAEATA